MAARHLSEPAAHRWLQRQAMAGGRKLADVAGDVVSGKEAGGAR